MSVDLHVKVQVKENDEWKTITLNDNDEIVWCGRWFHSLVYDADFNGKCDNIEVDGYGCTCVLYNTFADWLHDRFHEQLIYFERELNNSQLRSINNKLDYLMNNKTNVSFDEDEYYDIREEIEEEMYDILSGYKILGYAFYLKELYSKDYIDESNLRIIYYFT